MLKIKKIVNYRQAKISRDGRDRNCGHCVSAKLIAIHNCGTSEKIGEGLRCRVIGLRETQNAAVAVNHICDQFICHSREGGNPGESLDARIKSEHDGKQTCRVCGCTDNDCSQCIEKTGQPCYWVEEDLCSACAGKS
ncbi:MAG: hypothetical protein AB1423_14335 [Pseudomonadota bacterium]